MLSAILLEQTRPPVALHSPDTSASSPQTPIDRYLRIDRLITPFIFGPIRRGTTPINRSKGKPDEIFWRTSGASLCFCDLSCSPHAVPSCPCSQRVVVNLQVRLSRRTEQLASDGILDAREKVGSLLDVVIRC